MSSGDVCRICSTRLPMCNENFSHSTPLDFTISHRALLAFLMAVRPRTPMYVNVYTFIYICIYVCVYVYVYIYIYSKQRRAACFFDGGSSPHSYVCKCVYIYLYIYIYIYVGVYIYMYTYTYIASSAALLAFLMAVLPRTPMYIYLYTFIYICIHGCINVYVYTYIYSKQRHAIYMASSAALLAFLKAVRPSTAMYVNLLCM